MASTEVIIPLYMATADSDPQEAQANISELSRSMVYVGNYILIAGIQARELKLLDFVQILGQYLTSEEPRLRKHGIKGRIA